jgi:hypothetical protein
VAVTLHTDAVSLPRSRLDARFKDAIAEVVRRQGAASGPTSAQSETPSKGVVLEDGTEFLPDGQDAKAGAAGTVIGIVAAVLGLAFVGILADGAQAQPWMRYAAPALLGAGGYLVWTGRVKSKAAKAAPRTTGVYLFDDALLHVATFGCRVYPIERVRGFDHRAGSDERSERLLIRYADDGGVDRQDVLVHEDLREPLEAWLARAGEGARDGAPAPGAPLSDLRA